MVAVLTQDWDTYLVSVNDELHSNGLSVVGANGAIHNMSGSDGIEICRSFDA